MNDQGEMFPTPDDRKPWQRSELERRVDGNLADLWDLEEGKRLRDEGIAKVTEHTDRDYRAAFARIVSDFRQQGRDFTSEDITARIGFPDAHPNSIGALTRALAVRYGAQKVGRVKAQRAVRHANEIVVWGWR